MLFYKYQQIRQRDQNQQFSYEQVIPPTISVCYLAFSIIVYLNASFYWNFFFKSIVFM